MIARFPPWADHILQPVGDRLMSKRAQAPSGEQSVAALPPFKGFNGEAVRIAVWPMELWLQWQADLLKSAGPALAGWMARRQEGTEAALHALEQLCACEDFAAASRIQSEWIADETRRLETDLRALGGAALIGTRAATAEAAKAAAE
jgi:hypothetical protein